MSDFFRRRITGRECDDGVVVRIESDGGVQALDPTASSVWRIADGTRSVQSASRELGLDQRTIWMAIDRLADLGLLASRPTPPGAESVVIPLADSTSRRRVLQLGLAAATAGAVIATNGVAAAASASAELKQKQNAEQKSKNAEQKSKM